MRPIAVLLAAILSGLFSPCDLVADEGSLSTTQKNAIARIEAAGGVIQSTNGRPARIRFPQRNATDSVFQDIVAVGRLTSLDLSGCKISDNGLLRLKNAQISQLHLAETPVSDTGMRHLAGMKSLMLLNIEKTNVTDIGLSYLAKLPRLGDVKIAETKITNAGLRHLVSTPSVWRLSLGSAGISDEGLIHIGKLCRLSSLTVQSSNITNAGLQHLRTLPKLSQLILIDTRATPEGINQLKKSRAGLAVIVRNTPAKKTVVSSRPKQANPKTTRPSLFEPRTTPPKSTARATNPPIIPNSNTKSESIPALAISSQEAVRKLKSFGAEVEVVNGKAIRVDFDGNHSKLTDTDLAVVSVLDSLQSLDLSQTSVTDALLKRITHLKQLKTLYLYKTNVTWIGISELEESIPKLKTRATAPSEKRPNKWVAYVWWIPVTLVILFGVTMMVGFVKFFRHIQAGSVSNVITRQGLKPDQSTSRLICLGAKLFGAFGMVIGLPFVITGTSTALTANATKGWPTVDGQVVVARVIKRVHFDRSNSGYRSGDGSSYVPVIIYQYEIGGSQYTGDRVAYYRLGHDAAKDSATTYAKGPITVYYNKDDPADSVIEPGTGFQNFLGIGLGGIWVVIGVVVFCIARAKGKKLLQRD